MPIYKSFDIADRVVVVTGGAGILGSLYCRRLAEAGARVVIADLDPDTCRNLAKTIHQETGSICEGIAVDLALEQSVKDWAQRILNLFGSVDVLINNAAAKSPHFFATLESFPLEDWNRVMTVNVTGIFLAVRELGPSMVGRGKGSIINVSSIYGVVGPDQRIYEGSHYEDLGGKSIRH